MTDVKSEVWLDVIGGVVRRVSEPSGDGLALFHALGVEFVPVISLGGDDFVHVDELLDFQRVSLRCQVAALWFEQVNSADEGGESRQQASDSYEKWMK